MNRGDIVLVATPGDYGKPRPALAIQSNLFGEHPSITVCLLTSHLQNTPMFRHTVEPSAENGLAVVSQVQVDKIMTIPRQKVAQVVGHLKKKEMMEITRLIAVWLGIGD